MRATASTSSTAVEFIAVNGTKQQGIVRFSMSGGDVNAARPGDVNGNNNGNGDNNGNDNGNNGG